MSQPSVLIVDDDPALLQALPEALRLRMGGIEVDTADSAAAGLARVAARDYDAIVTDIKMPGMDGLVLLSEIRARRPDTPTLLITGHGEHALAIDALRGGAYDFIQKPIDRDYFVASLRRAIQMSELSRRVKAQQRALERRATELERTVEERTHELREAHQALQGPLRWLMGSSRQMAKVVQQIRQAADSPLTVLVEGETGTGKELVARAIHQLSARGQRPFVSVDCGTIPDTLIESELFGEEQGAGLGAQPRKPGQFQLAEGGSLFLDDVVNLPLPTQAKLVRVLQERQVQPLDGSRPVPVNVRIIAAATVPLEREVRAGRFRRDLYDGLRDVVITLPPLRQRDDILHLANEFLADASMELGRPCRGISEAAARILLHRPWPGNVRELRNVIRRAILLASDVIEPEHLSFPWHEDRRRQLLDHLEKQAVRVGEELHHEILNTLCGYLATAIDEEDYREAQRRLDELVSELRRIMNDLYPKDLETDGLLGVIHRRLAAAGASMQRRARPCQVDFDCPPEITDDTLLDTLRDRSHLVLLYRIVSEAIINVRKHSRATRVALTIRAPQSGIVEIVLADNGVGHGGPFVENVGLALMRRRAEEIGAEVDYQRTTPEGGTTVIIRLRQP